MSVAALNAAVTGAMAAQVQIDNIANNIANVATAGFKKSSVETADLFYMTLKKAGSVENAEASRRPVGVQIGYGTKVTGSSRNLAQGHLIQTNHALDIAITGRGYLAVTLPNGRVGYTRAGLLKKDPDSGLIVTTDGKPLTNNIAISDDIDVETINISKSGLITAPDPQNPGTDIEIGQIELFTFPNERGLQAIGDNTLEVTVASGEAIQIDDLTDRIQQKFYEGSNVTSVQELTELITAQRAFELNSRVIRVVDEVQKDANNIK